MKHGKSWLWQNLLDVVEMVDGSQISLVASALGARCMPCTRMSQHVAIARLVYLPNVVGKCFMLAHTPNRNSRFQFAYHEPRLRTNACFSVWLDIDPPPSVEALETVCAIPTCQLGSTTGLNNCQTKPDERQQETPMDNTNSTTCCQMLEHSFSIPSACKASTTPMCSRYTYNERAPTKSLSQMYRQTTINENEWWTNAVVRNNMISGILGSEERVCDQYM